MQLDPFSSPEPTILLACGRNRELWEQPFQACAIDADCVKPDGQNSVISFVISKWLLPELSFSDRWSRGTRLWERDCSKGHSDSFCCTFKGTEQKKNISRKTLICFRIRVKKIQVTSTKQYLGTCFPQGFFKNFRRANPSFLPRSPPGGLPKGLASMHTSRFFFVI